jgi:hypothetical protein
MRFQKGMCSPVVVAMVLGLGAVLGALKAKDDADKHGFYPLSKSMGVMPVVVSSFVSVAFLWVLCYYGYSGAAWFFLLAPMVLVGVEINAIVDGQKKAKFMNLIKAKKPHHSGGGAGAMEY